MLLVLIVAGEWWWWSAWIGNHAESCWGLVLPHSDRLRLRKGDCNGALAVHSDVLNTFVRHSVGGQHPPTHPLVGVGVVHGGLDAVALHDGVRSVAVLRVTREPDHL